MYGVGWTSKRFLPLLYRDARHSSLLAKWTANSRCLQLVLRQQCQGSYVYVKHTRLFSFTWITLFSLRLFSTTRQLPSFHLRVCLGLTADSQGGRALAHGFST